MVWMTGPCESSAAVPRASLAPGAMGTPKRMTDRRPFRMSGSRRGITLLMPRRDWFGRDGISVSSSAWSEMKSGNMSIDCSEQREHLP